MFLGIQRDSVMPMRFRMPLAGIGVVLSVVTLIGVPRSTYAQEADGRVEGRLVGGAGKGIAGATVVVNGADATDFT